MNRRARSILLIFVVAVFFGKPAQAQVVMQPTPNPTVTAENEPWYLNGEPITHAGNLYYPAGPQVHFNPDEMVRSGFYMGIPLYTRTTIEPLSVVYVPVGAALLQPYERPRTGTLAETSGSLPSSLPRDLPSEVAGAARLQAAGPPAQTTTMIPMHVPAPVGTAGVASQLDAGRTADPVGTARRTSLPRRGRPLGPYSIFIEFEGTRWYPAGAAEPIDTASMTRVGTYNGTPVWSMPEADEGIIYVPVTQAGGSLAVPYAPKR